MIFSSLISSSRSILRSKISEEWETGKKYVRLDSE